MKRQRLYGVVLLILLASSVLFSQQISQVSYTLEPQSRLWLDVTATIGEFTCETGDVRGYAHLSGDTSKQGEVSVWGLVNTLDCGNSMMNEDMYNAMNADRYPTIEYELIQAKAISDSTIDGWFMLKTTGSLTINGVSNQIEMVVRVKALSGNQFRLIGTKTLSMHDFNIIPPTALWGLIKAHDTLVVNFDLIASALLNDVQKHGPSETNH